MDSDDIVDELRFRVTVTRLGGQHTAREVMSDIMAMENARDEIVRLRAERDVARMRVRAEMARRGLLRTQLSPWFDPDIETVVVPYMMNSEIAQAWQFLAWLDNETEARRDQ